LIHSNNCIGTEKLSLIQFARQSGDALIWVSSALPSVGFFVCKERSNTKDPTDGKAGPTDKFIAFEYLPVVEVGKAQHQKLEA
jgi:hypothetical protein